MTIISPPQLQPQQKQTPEDEMKKLSVETYKRLQNRSNPFEPLDKALNRILDQLDIYENKSAAPIPIMAPVAVVKKPNVPKAASSTMGLDNIFIHGKTHQACAEKFQWNGAPTLKFTEITSVVMNGRELHGIKSWSPLLRQILIYAREKTPLDADFERLIGMRFKYGNFTENSFRYIPEINGSVQNQGAQRTWVIISNIAKKLNIKLFVSFKWFNDAGSNLRGSRGYMEM
jgi:hypothetical protein